jgi:hypothetical protein
MAKSKKPRKAYRPREVDHAGVWRRKIVHTQMRHSRDMMDRDAIVTHGVLYSCALASLMRGTGSGVDATHLAIAANVALVLCEGVFEGFAGVEQIKAGQDAIVSLMGRGDRIGRWLLAGSEVSAIQAMLDIHMDQLRAGVTVGEWAAAVDEVGRRMRSGDVITMQATAA